MTTSMEWTPSDSAWRHAASTAANPSGEHGGEDFHHSADTVVGPGQLTLHAVKRRRQHPILDRRAVAQSTPACAPEPARNAGDHKPSRRGQSCDDVLLVIPPVLADHNAIGAATWMSTGRPTALALTECLLLSNQFRQVFDTEAGKAWNPSKQPR